MNGSLEHGTQGNLPEPYISSLNTANPLSVKIGQAVVPPHNQRPNDQDMQQQEEEYKKSVTIIFWYKGNTPPIRLQQMIPTFPFFQFSKLTSLVIELGLSPTSYLDTYNPTTEQWDQHPISAVRMIETQQRLLYRTRKSLLEGLTDEDCSGLYDELEIQRRLNKPFRTTPSSSLSRQRDSTPKSPYKRPAPDDIDTSHNHSPKVHIPNNYYIGPQPILHRDNDQGSLADDSGPGSNIPISPSASHPPASQSIPTPPSSTSSNIPTDEFSYPNTSMYDNSAPSSSTPTLSSSITVPIAYPPHPPLKRWPNDYTVAEISAGFTSMDALVAQSANGSTMTHKVAFERVFGSRYVKSTVCRHRGVWKKAHPSLRAQYEAMGNDERAYWGEFVRHVEGRPPSLRVGGANSVLNPPSGGNAGSRQGITSEDEDGGHVDDPQVIESLQGGQVGPASSATMQSLNVYDTTLVPPMTNNTHG